MKEKGFFLFFCMIFAGSSIFGQKNFQPGLNPQQINTKNSSIVNFSKISLTGNELTTPPVVLTVIRPDYYTRNFGFFCKKELQLEKVVKIPFKFRVGSIQYCDWMEGKRR